MAKRTVLVTGGAGFIGSHIVDKLIARGDKVIIVDNLSTGRLEYLNPLAKFYKLDIREDLSEIFKKYNIDYVIHQAAQIDVQQSIKDPSFDGDVNIIGTTNLLEHCCKYNIKKIIYASTAAVYGQPKYLGVDEEHPINPISYYGISKHTPEHYIKVFSQLYGLNYTILRYSNVYGIRQGFTSEGGVISIFIDKFLSGERPIIYGDGKQTRDFIYVDDIVRANIIALEKGDNEAINISCNHQTSLNQLIMMMKSILAVDLNPIYKSAKLGDIKYNYLSNKKAKEVLGWTPNYGLSEGLEEIFAYYQSLYQAKVEIAVSRK
ncbi:NAD-dependent epimerase/dehydratase family protein [Orenia marismortui]|uniref:UDP-glucose 4-epimerase n=1 Tax=Orenia marismortui TaxID=46469 RepID=A0A4R8HRP9_9FIRM|nr:NAD-dependent epimerase/dehydratase family protein [Orenia marismortui]TDX59277.1 UDP-glucose 4-epimerase [Orenia marismortui]